MRIMTLYLEVKMCTGLLGGGGQQATQFQASRDPIRRESVGNNRRNGRRGTILSSPAAQGEVNVSNKKTQLGT